MTHKILAIDDHPQTLDIIIITLQQHGYLTIGSNAPLEAMSIAEKERPDLILLDMNMPILNGKELCRRFRAHPDFANVPIIMFSAEAAEKLAGFEAGADDFLVKPTDPVEMIERIEAVLESRAGKAQTEGDPATEVALQAEATGDPGDEQAPPEMDHVAPSSNCRLVAVLGVRGGAGTTTVAINLAASAAEAGYPTVLVDHDVRQGHVGLYLKVKGAGGINALARLPDHQLVRQLPQALVSYHENLKLLIANPDLGGRYPTLSADQMNNILGALMQSNRCIVIDLGREVSEVGRVVLDKADEVIVCVRPERVALSAARGLLRQLEKLLPFGTALRILYISNVGGMNLPQSSVEAFLGHPVLAELPALPQEMGRALNQGIPFVQLYPESSVANWFRRLAEQFAEARKVGT